MSEWIEWNGGECPVPKDTFVDVKFRTFCGWNGIAKLLRWDWDHIEQSEYDIIAYRIHEPDKITLKLHYGVLPNPTESDVLNGGNVLHVPDEMVRYPDPYPCKHEFEDIQCKPCDAYHMHELLDRVSMLQYQFERHIAEHPAAEQFRKRIHGISKRLGKLYQEIGAAHLKE